MKCNQIESLTCGPSLGFLAALPAALQARIAPFLGAATDLWRAQDSLEHDWHLEVRIDKLAGTPWVEWTEYQVDEDSAETILPECYGYTDDRNEFSIRIINNKTGLTDYPRAAQVFASLRPELSSFTNLQEEVAVHATYQMIRGYRQLSSGLGEPFETFSFK